MPRSLFEGFAWQFSDAVPALHIPSALHWAKPDVFRSTASGAVLIVYRLVVVVLIVNLITDLTRLHEARTEERADAPPPSAEPQPSAP